jgi:hypothetical protein
MDFPIAVYLFCLILYFTRSWQHLHYAVAGACAAGLPLVTILWVSSLAEKFSDNFYYKASSIYYTIMCI